MPELPEVETVRLQLKHKVIGKTIDSVEVFHDKTTGNDTEFEAKLIGKIIEDIDRVGKLLIFTFKNARDVYLLAHLKMTGQFFFVDKMGEISGGGHSVSKADLDLPGRHTRVAFHFTDKSTLYFNDMRLFGYTKVVTKEVMEKSKNGFGPEPIADDFDCKWFFEKLQTRKVPIKAALLDQSFVAGLGNIYVDEALWRAGISPNRRANEVTKKEAAALCAAAGDVMKESIKVGGTTFQHFVDTSGKKGNFTEYLQVFGKQNSPCPRCKDTIVKIRTAGRGTHYCPTCQK